MLGLGAERLTRIPTDAQGRMRADALASALRGRPALRSSARRWATSTAARSIRSPRSSAAARDRGAWLHVDGAFGLWAAASAPRRHLVAGVEQADSVATDAHKWLNVPYDCGVAFCAHPDAHRRAMSLSAAYIVESAAERDPHDFVPEESRRARAVPVYAALGVARARRPRRSRRADVPPRRPNRSATFDATRLCACSTTSCSIRCWCASTAPIPTR